MGDTTKKVKKKLKFRVIIPTVCIVVSILLLICYVVFLIVPNSSNKSINGIATQNAGYSFDSASSASGGYSYDDVVYEAEIADEYAIPAEVGAEMLGLSDSTQESIEDGKLDTEKLVYRGNIVFDTLDFDDAVEQIRHLVDIYSCFLENETVGNDGYWSRFDYYGSNNSLRNYDATIRIPSNKYEEFMKWSSFVGSIRSKSSSVENITQRYSTAQTSLEIYQAKYDRYLELMRRADTVEDMVSIEHELTDLEVKITDYKNQISIMDTDVAYSYIYVTIREVTSASELSDGDTFLSRLVETIKDSGKGFLGFLQGILFWIIMYFWYLIILVVIIIIIKVYRRKKNKPRISFAKFFKIFYEEVSEDDDKD